MANVSKATGTVAASEPAAEPGSRRGRARSLSLRQQVRQALAHLEDLGYLELHPLSRAVAPYSQTSGLAPARFLRTWLLEAIEELRVQGHGGRNSHGRIPLYELARLRYLESWPVTEVRDALTITHSEYYRQHTRLLVALAAAIQARLELSERRLLDGAAPIVETSRHYAGAADNPFVGRSAELEAALEAYATVASGAGGRLIAIGGESGIGKTRFAEEVGGRALARGGRFLVGRYPRGSGAVYGPWVELLRPALAGAKRGEMARLVGPFGLALASVFPELIAAGLAGSAGDGLDRGILGVADQRQRLRDGITHVLRELSATQPVVLLLDDLHWAPDGDLLAHVAGSLATTRVLLLATYRTHALRARPGLQQVVDDLTRGATSMRLMLQPLLEEETGTLARLRVGETVAGKLGAALFETTRGNPYLIDETLRSLGASGGLSLAAEEWQAARGASMRLPASAQRLVLERVSQLGDAAADALGQASVLGQEFSYAGLHALTGLSEDALVSVLERALEADVLVDRTEDGDERYAFADAHLHELLYSSLSAPRRRQLHRRAAEVIPP